MPAGLERDFEAKDNIPKLSLSLEVRNEIMGEIALDDLVMAGTAYL